jgi:hypothetical protein
MLLNNLKAEIDARLLASNPEIIVDALDRILQELSGLLDKNRGIQRHHRGDTCYVFSRNDISNNKSTLSIRKDAAERWDKIKLFLES